MGIKVSWDDFCDDYITISISKGWQIEDVVSAIQQARAIEKATRCHPNLLIRIEGGLGMPPPRLISRLKRMYIRPITPRRTIVVTGMAHDLAFAQNLLFATLPKIFQQVQFIPNSSDAVKAVAG